MRIGSAGDEQVNWSDPYRWQLDWPRDNSRHAARPVRALGGVIGLAPDVRFPSVATLSLSADAIAHQLLRSEEETTDREVLLWVVFFTTASRPRFWRLV